MAHNLEIANNRVYNNQGTLAGGIAVGQGNILTSTSKVVSTRNPALARPAPSPVLRYVLL